MSKWIAIPACACLLVLCATTIIAEDKPAEDTRELEGYWTPIPDSPKHRTAADDIKTREIGMPQPTETRAF